MSNGMNACAQSARGVNQSSPNLVGGFTARTVSFLKRVLMQALSLRRSGGRALLVIFFILLRVKKPRPMDVVIT